MRSNDGIMVSRRNQRNAERNLLQCHVVKHEYNLKSVGTKHGLLALKTGSNRLSYGAPYSYL